MILGRVVTFHNRSSGLGHRSAHPGALSATTPANMTRVARGYAAVITLLVILWAVWQSKRESAEMTAMHSELTD